MAPYRQGLIIMEKVGFPPGMERHALCSGPFQLCSSAGNAEPAVGSWILQLMTAFHQRSSCCLCLSLPLWLPHNACGFFYPKNLPAQLRGKGFKAFCSLGEGKKSQEWCFSTSLLVCSFPWVSGILSVLLNQSRQEPGRF